METITINVRGKGRLNTERSVTSMDDMDQHGGGLAGDTDSDEEGEVDDDDDLYGDLEGNVFNNNSQQQQTRHHADAPVADAEGSSQLQSLLADAYEEINRLRSKLKALSKSHAILLKNASSLHETAKFQIQQKNQVITSLHKKLQDFRVKGQGAASQTDWKELDNLATTSLASVPSFSFTELCEEAFKGDTSEKDKGQGTSDTWNKRFRHENVSYYFYSHHEKATHAEPISDVRYSSMEVDDNGADADHAETVRQQLPSSSAVSVISNAALKGRHVIGPPKQDVQQTTPPGHGNTVTSRVSCHDTESSEHEKLKKAKRAAALAKTSAQPSRTHGSESARIDHRDNPEPSRIVLHRDTAESWKIEHRENERSSGESRSRSREQEYTYPYGGRTRDTGREKKSDDHRRSSLESRDRRSRPDTQPRRSSLGQPDDLPKVKGHKPRDRDPASDGRREAKQRERK